jgi:hypothetical protein
MPLQQFQPVSAPPYQAEAVLGASSLPDVPLTAPVAPVVVAAEQPSVLSGEQGKGKK